MNARPYRWVALSIFVLSSAINYLDRQTLATVAPLVRAEFHLSNAQYGLILTAFSIAYAGGAPFAGMLIDRIGLNRAISLAIGVWSCAGIFTGFTRGLAGLLGCRCVLGMSEAAGIPAARGAAEGAEPGAGRADPERSYADPEAGYVLFTDADIAWAPGALHALVAAAEGDDRDLVSQMALLRTATGWERLIVPAFEYFFAQLYPFRRVNKPGSRTAAAAGGCMLVRRGALERSGGVAPIRGALIDDVAMGAMIKGQRGRCWLGLSRQVVSVRPYPGLASLWQMVARSAYTQLNYSPLLLAGTLLGLLFSYALPPAAAITGVVTIAAGTVTAPAALAAGAGLAGWALMSLSYLPMLRLYRLSPLRAPGLPLIALLYAAMTADSARRHYAGRGAEWRGRTNRTRLR